LEPIKGPNIALHVARELANAGLDFELHLAGTGPLSGPLEDLMTRLDIGPRVRFLGVVDDMPGFYADLDLLIHPALREPCANVIPEAHAWGVPVIATKVDGMPELLPAESQQLLINPTSDLDEYRGLGASDGRMPPWVYDPESDELRAPRFVAAERWVAPILDLVGDPSSYEAASSNAVRFIQESFLPEQAMGLASRHLRKIAGAGHAD
jgi:glycosyltransferase involved in cell wall biosynthesis